MTPYRSRQNVDNTGCLGPTDYLRGSHWPGCSDHTPTDKGFKIDAPHGQAVQTVAPTDKEVKNNYPTDNGVKTDAPTGQAVQTIAPTDKEVENNPHTDQVV